MHITSLKQTSPTEIAVTWSDGHSSRIPLTLFRDACPCAGCQGETILFRTYVPPAADKTIAGRYTLTNITTVGNYAIKPVWGDGHDMGMYTWEHLRSLCQCDECVARMT